MEQHIQKSLRLTIPQASPVRQNDEAEVLLSLLTILIKSENVLTATGFPIEFSKFLTTGN